jgi:hypothetical protein
MQLEGVDLLSKTASLVNIDPENIRFQPYASLQEGSDLQDSLMKASHLAEQRQSI